MIEANAISVAIGDKTIVSGVDFSVDAGEFVAIVGPNGSGKTTFLRALCGDLVHGGTVRMDGDDMRAMKPWQAASRRGVLPQATSLAFPFTVREVVRLGLLAGRSGASAMDEQRLPELALARVDLAGFAGRFYQELSGGEQQRVQLARVLCQMWEPVLDGKARYLFLDEPVSSLDIKHQLIIMDIARDFARRGGGVVAVLHDLNLTAMYADRVMVMRGGKLAASGTPAAVLTDSLIEDVFDCRLRVGVPPAAGIPFVLPQTAY